MLASFYWYKSYSTGNKPYSEMFVMDPKVSYSHASAAWTHTNHCDTDPLLCHNTVCPLSSGWHWPDIPCWASEWHWRSVFRSKGPWADGQAAWWSVSVGSQQNYVRSPPLWCTFIIAGRGREILTFSSLPTRIDATIWQAFDLSKNVSFKVKRYPPKEKPKITTWFLHMGKLLPLEVLNIYDLFFAVAKYVFRVYVDLCQSLRGTIQARAL